jgi:hypothetical protein
LSARSKPPNEPKPNSRRSKPLPRKSTALAAPAGELPTPPQIEQVIRWIVEGATEYQILEAIAATFPKASTKPLIAAAVDELTKKGELDGKLVRGWAFEATRELYRKMIDVADYNGALRAVKQIYEMG